MTLQEYRNTKYENLFLAVVAKDIDWDEAKEVNVYLEAYPEGVTPLELLRMAVEMALVENGEFASEENIKQIEDEVKETIKTTLEEYHYVILLKNGEEYIDLSQMQVLDQKKYEIRFSEPFSKYYGPEDYSFEEDDDGPYLAIEMEPFELFIKEYEKIMD